MPKSARYLESNLSNENSASSPTVISLITKYLKISAPYSSTKESGSTTCPVLFDIFSPEAVHQPCAKIVLGISRLQALSIIGQYTACGEQEYPSRSHVNPQANIWKNLYFQNLLHLHNLQVHQTKHKLHNFGRMGEECPMITSQRALIYTGHLKVLSKIQ